MSLVIVDAPENRACIPWQVTRDQLRYQKCATYEAFSLVWLTTRRLLAQPMESRFVSPLKNFVLSARLTLLSSDFVIEFVSSLSGEIHEN